MNNFDKILNLVKKTGDKIVVMSEDGNTNFLVMPLSEYEKIVEGRNNVKDLSEQELLDQIDRDIALWRAEHKEDKSVTPEEPMSDWEPGFWNRGVDFADEVWDKGSAVERREGERESIRDVVKEMELEEFNVDKEPAISDNENNESIKYEDIPPPPDIASREAFKEEALRRTQNMPPVIDFGFEDEEMGVDDKKKESGEEWFEEEPVY